MSRMNRVENMFEVLDELSEKYADYKPAAIMSAEFHNPETKEQEEKAKKMVKGVLVIYYIASIAFVATFVAAIFKSTEIWATILMGVLSFVLVALTLKTQFKKVKILTGKAIYKEKHKRGESAGKYIYYISVIPDNGQKIVYRRIQVSRDDYEQIKEGTPVMVVNSGSRACIL